jgi:AcrR family transcriptional regulator
MNVNNNTNEKKENTRKSIKQALLRLEKNKPKIVAKGRKLSVAAVAQEAGISNANIHNNYPELAELIRNKIDKSSRLQRDEKQEALKQEKEKCREQRNEIAALEADLARITSINARLIVENKELRAITTSSNVSIFKQKN